MYDYVCVCVCMTMYVCMYVLCMHANTISFILPSKIGDFGMSRVLEDHDYYITRGGQVPVKWTAPEVSTYNYISSWLIIIMKHLFELAT